MSCGDLIETPPPIFTQYILDILTLVSTLCHMPGGRMTSSVHELERSPVPLLATPHAGHACGSVVEVTTPPVLPQIRYVCLLEGFDRDASGQGDVCQGGRAYTQANGGVGVTGKHGSGLPGLWRTLGYGDGI